MLPQEDRRPPLGGRHHEMLLRLDDEVFKMLTARAREEGASLSEIVRSALRAHLCDYSDVRRGPRPE